MDLLDEGDSTGGNLPEVTVSELSGAVKRTIEGEFSYVRVRGELGRVTRPRSGHVYLDLKDDRAVLAGVMWKGVAARQQTQPEEGMEVIATGRLTTFPGQSRYQIVIDDIRPAGVGALMAMLEKRRAMLAAEGLFDAARKKPLPMLPEVIGVVTSPTGAVIRDILHRLRDRFPRKVLIWPVAVQGQGSAEQVARGIAGFNAMTPGGALPRPDVLIVARGGGSIEDLWGFNEEIVVRAAAASEIPLMSAVGHETDTTLIDHAADLRAPTPTAAAEQAVPVRSELLAWLGDRGARMARAQSDRLSQRGQRLRDLGRVLPRPETLTEAARQRLDLAGERLPQALIRGVERRRLHHMERSAGLRPQILVSLVAAQKARLAPLGDRLAPALTRRVDQRRQALALAGARLGLAPLQRRTEIGRSDLVRLSQRLRDAGAALVQQRRAPLDTLDRLHETLGYRATLARGYAVVRSDEGLVTTRAAAETASGLEIEFADGSLKLGGARRPKASKTAKPPEQGSLF